MEWNVSDSDLRTVIRWTLALLAALGLAVLWLVLQTPLRSPIQAMGAGLLALNSEQASWYVTRAAGLTAYFLLWLSTAWGLAISTRILDTGLPRAFTFDAHEFLSLLALGFTAVHVGALAFDHYLPFSMTQLLIPFTATYRPVWVGLGVIGMYVAILVSATFYVRRRIGAGTFRAIHYLSYAGYVMVTLHAWFAGTDTPLAATRGLYLAGFLVILFLSVFRVTKSLEAKA